LWCAFFVRRTNRQVRVRWLSAVATAISAADFNILNPTCDTVGVSAVFGTHWLRMVLGRKISAFGFSFLEELGV
jgi:hypothetical protein